MNKNVMNILVACEESQAITMALRKLGHNAFSCDYHLPSGYHPEWHILGDVTPYINGNCEFMTMKKVKYRIDGKWDLLIAHPPCTYMSNAGARWLFPKPGVVNEERLKLAMEAKEFFMQFINADCDRICVENPRPLGIVGLPPHTQVIQPYEYGHPYSKRTYLWLKNLPNLVPTNILTEYVPYLPSNAKNPGALKTHTSRNSSKTFPGVAEAIANQWGNFESNSVLTAIE